MTTKTKQKPKTSSDIQKLQTTISAMKTEIALYRKIIKGLQKEKSHIDLEEIKKVMKKNPK
jgi:hypothetical protein